MTTRKPLVIVAGTISELPAGDSIATVAPTSSLSLSAIPVDGGAAASVFGINIYSRLDAAEATQQLDGGASASVTNLQLDAGAASSSLSAGIDGGSA